MRAGIYYNKNYLTENKTYLENIKKQLTDKGIDCVIVNSYEDIANLDVLLILGGDGTISSIARRSVGNFPLLKSSTASSALSG